MHSKSTWALPGHLVQSRTIDENGNGKIVRYSTVHREPISSPRSIAHPRLLAAGLKWPLARLAIQAVHFRGLDMISSKIGLCKWFRRAAKKRDVVGRPSVLPSPLSRLYKSYPPLPPKKSSV
jgi:hypothetical protein